MQPEFIDGDALMNTLTREGGGGGLTGDGLGKQDDRLLPVIVTRSISPRLNESSVVGGSCMEQAVMDGHPSIGAKLLVSVLVSEKLRGSFGADDVRTYRYVVHASIQVQKSCTWRFTRPCAAGDWSASKAVPWSPTDLKPKRTSGMLGQAERLR